MRFLAPAAALLGACVLCAAGARAQPTDDMPELQPYQMVRSLQHVQDRVAVGDHAALPIQRRLLEMIDERLRKASAAELMQPTNLQAMLVYAMSGGNPATLKSILLRLHLEERDSRIAAGILGYLNGGTRNAAAVLKPVDPMQEPAEIGSFIALLKGSLTALEDPVGALRMLDQARLLSPGSLVEEAALRRSITLAATVEDPQRFVRALDQYARGYIRSPYASQFADALVAGVIKLQDKLDLASVDAVVALMNPEQRKVVYLRIARRAAIEGFVALSKYAAAKADAVDIPSEQEKDPRLLLYTSLTSVATEPADVIRERIGKIDRKKLSEGDRELLDAVLAVSNGIVDKPAPLAPIAIPPKPDPAVAEKPAVSLPIAGAPNDAAPGAPNHDDAGQADIAPEKASPEDADIPPVVEASAEPQEAEPAVDEEPALAEPAARPEMAADGPASTTAAAGKAAAPADPVDAAVADGRKRLAEIDALLAGAED
ncbi:chemotaxis protein MotC [Mesorhizobium sp. IMUNJ 23232]|uniref:chemotaxis protein MotC n=1 Tax=Mesorhizobium sp. IMUNJ 23232 TaxID=3376064 RepID=UPI0037B63A2F